MICPTCDRENPADAIFCMGCATQLGEKTEEATTPSNKFTPTSGFVGRQREMEQLTAALEDARVGRGQLVMLAGEPGIGKTRLAQEIATVAENRGANILWGRCYEDEGAPPYWPWIQPLRAYIEQTDSEQLKRESGPRAAEIVGILPELREKLPGLEPPPLLDPEQARFRLFDAVTTFLKNVSQRQWLVLVLDDLHWADRPSLLLLEFIARELPSSSLLILGSYRDVEVARRHPLYQSLGNLIREPVFSRVELRGLGREEVSQLVHAASADNTSAGIVDALHRRTEGNPLFVSEILRMLSREELAGGEDTSRSIPAGVKEAISRRLDQVSESCNHILSLASVVGREFDYQLLQSLSGENSDEEFQESIEEGLESHLIEEVSDRVDRYQFTHALIQETLAEELSTSRKVRLHARIAEALEELYGEAAEIHASELAHHFAEAEAVLGPDKLIKYSLLAGGQALATYAWEEAQFHFERGLASKEGQAIDAISAEMLFGIGRAQLATFERASLGEAISNLGRAFDYYVASGEVSQAIAVADYPFLMGGDLRHSAMAEIIVRALDLVPADSPESGRLLSRYGAALGPVPESYHAARKAFDDALAIARREGDNRLEIRTLVNSGRLDALNLQMEESLAKTLRAIELLDEVDDPVSELPAHFWSTNILLGQGDLAGAKAHASATVGPAERVRNSTLMAIAGWTNGPVALMQGDWEAARDFISRGLAGAPRESLLLAPGALVEYQLGEFNNGEVLLERLLESVGVSGSSLGVGLASSVIPLAARITGDFGRLEVAEAIAVDRLSSPLTSPLSTMLARTGLALIGVQRPDPMLAREQYQALGSARTGEWFGIMCTDRLLGLLARTFGDPDQAARHFEDGLAFCRKGYRPELAWTAYDFADFLLQQGNSSDQEWVKSLLEESLVIAAELGMIPLKDRVKRLQEQAINRPSQVPAYPDGLSQREVEVLRLVAAGKNNREIAEELVVSVGTVANHVTSILNKAGLNNRTEAAGYAIRQGLSN